jgi:sarcosine oxidase
LDRFPIFSLDSPEGLFYGFPVYEVPGFKLGRDRHLRERVDPDHMERTANAEDERLLREGICKYFPDANGPTLSLKTCLYTNTPDRHFIIDFLPSSPRILVAGGFSGYGFKFSSVIGEIMADLALQGETRHDLTFFRLGRFMS